MKLLISGEGPRDLGTCNNAQSQCSDEAFNRGPMAVWLGRLWESLLSYNLLDTPEAVQFVSKTALAEQAKNSDKRMQPLRSKKQGAETGLYFNNAQQLGLMAKQLAADYAGPVMAVLFRDADGTASAPGQMWQAKWDSMVNGFRSVEFDFGVPMLPNPKSEAWLLCAGQKAQHSHAALENISGNDNSPNAAKDQWEAFMGAPQNAASEADWCANNPQDWSNLRTMPSFQAFYDRFHEVAQTILHPASRSFT
ncbi:hypothetical protein C5F52_18140 [Limnohabitans sp. TS-CS-82]|uniref:hypothetical protein n=1 Tax=Limnohabitans sp. TS-CS-82 TaxID=2094193 RepID=UPI000CF2913D|nr:hypothetical protein [Limnohabitans sp. TS-CS-82]PQA81930.1 hypothetical protein C5F52_18140 [Limnohabitans sp. TS-CS-82]